MARRTPESFVPLRSVELHVLLALARGSRHGYGIMQDALRQSDGTVALEAGTLYRALRRMQTDGLVAETTADRESETEDERRRYYRLTDLGRRTAEVEAERLSRLVAVARQGRLLGRARLGKAQR